MKILTGNSFPLSLIRRPVKIELVSPELYVEMVKNNEVYSFWGHHNSLEAVKKNFGIDLTPRLVRPALSLNSDFLPQLDGEVFRECWILSCDYRSGFRPEIGIEVTPEDITGWHTLKIIWP